jgi:AcrR family transcriptional regulator
MIKRRGHEAAFKAAKTKSLIWQRAEAARGSHKLGFASITGAAMELADKGGLEDVSIRKIANRLESGTMSLYRYVLGKNDLWDLMLDAAFGEISLPSSPAKNWRRDLILVAVETRRTMLRHPWLVPLATARPTLGPCYLRWFEFLLATTAGKKRDLRTRVRIIGALWAYTSGFAGYELGERETNRRHSLTEDRKRSLAAPYLEQVIATGNFPCFAEFLREFKPGDSDVEFEIGLRALLKGLAS